MKKMYIVIIAAVMALGFSAFTPKSTPTFQTVYFQDDDGNWISQNLTPCTPGTNPVCEVTTLNGYGTRRIFQSASTSNPFTKQ